MPKTSTRPNQRHRTRKDLLAAAARLLKTNPGQTPDMDEIAREAMVSRATAYRYFPTVESIMVEAPIDGETPTPDSVFAGDNSTDPVTRADKAEAAMHEMTFRNEARLRLLLKSAIERAGGGVPIRQNRRIPLIEAALAPARKQFTPANYKNLCATLALIFGTESMIVFRDVLNIDEASARKIKSWAIRALITAAMRG